MAATEGPSRLPPQIQQNVDAGEKVSHQKGHKGIKNLTHQEKASKPDEQRRLSVSCKQVGAKVVPASGKSATTLPSSGKTPHHITPGDAPKSNDVEKAAEKTVTMRFMVEVNVSEKDFTQNLAGIDRGVVDSILASVEDRGLHAHFQANRGEIEQTLGRFLNVTYADNFRSVPTANIHALARTIHQGGGVGGARSPAEIAHRGFAFDHTSRTMFCAVRNEHSLAQAHRHLEDHGIDPAMVNLIAMSESDFAKFVDIIAEELARIHGQKETSQSKQPEKVGREPIESPRQQKQDVRAKEHSKGTEEVQQHRPVEKSSVKSDDISSEGTKKREEQMKSDEKKVDIEKTELKRAEKRKENTKKEI